MHWQPQHTVKVLWSCCTPCSNPTTTTAACTFARPILSDTPVPHSLPRTSLSLTLPSLPVRDLTPSHSITHSLTLIVVVLVVLPIKRKVVVLHGLTSEPAACIHTYMWRGGCVGRVVTHQDKTVCHARGGRGRCTWWWLNTCELCAACNQQPNTSHAVQHMHTQSLCPLTHAHVQLAFPLPLPLPSLPSSSPIPSQSLPHHPTALGMSFVRMTSAMS